MDNPRGSSLAQRLRYSLMSLEDRDLESQAVWGLRGVIDQARSSKDLKYVVKELLTGLDNTGGAARRQRYVLASYAVERSPADAVQQVVPLVMRQVTKRLGEEKQSANVEAISDLAGRAIERMMVHQDQVLDGEAEEIPELSGDWLSKIMVNGFIKSTCKGPDKGKVAMGCSLLHSVLSILRDWTHVPGVVPTVIYTLEQMVKTIQTASGSPKAAESYMPIQRCMEMLGVHCPPDTLSMAIQVCLHGTKERDDWQVRRGAIECLTIIAASVQVQEQTSDGGWQLKRCPVLDVVMQKKEAIQKVLSNCKYDKIMHVRKAAISAVAEMENIPNPISRSVPPPRKSTSPVKPARKTISIPTRADLPRRSSASTSRRVRDDSHLTKMENPNSLERRSLDSTAIKSRKSLEPRRSDTWAKRDERKLAKAEKLKEESARLSVRSAERIKKSRTSLQEIRALSSLPKEPALDFGIQVFAPNGEPGSMSSSGCSVNETTVTPRGPGSCEEAGSDGGKESVSGKSSRSMWSTPFDVERDSATYESKPFKDVSTQNSVSTVGVHNQEPKGRSLRSTWSSRMRTNSFQAEDTQDTTILRGDTEDGLDDDAPLPSGRSVSSRSPCSSRPTDSHELPVSMDVETMEDRPSTSYSPPEQPSQGCGQGKAKVGSGKVRRNSNSDSNTSEISFSSATSKLKVHAGKDTSPIPESPHGQHRMSNLSNALAEISPRSKIQGLKELRAMLLEGSSVAHHNSSDKKTGDILDSVADIHGGRPKVQFHNRRGVHTTGQVYDMSVRQTDRIMRHSSDGCVSIARKEKAGRSDASEASTSSSTEHRIGHQDHLSSKKLAELPEECEEMLDRTICTLKKCMQDLPKTTTPRRSLKSGLVSDSPRSAQKVAAPGSPLSQLDHHAQALKADVPTKGGNNEDHRIAVHQPSPSPRTSEDSMPMPPPPCPRKPSVVPSLQAPIRCMLGGKRSPEMEFMRPETGRLSQISEVEHHEDNPLYGALSPKIVSPKVEKQVVPKEVGGNKWSGVMEQSSSSQGSTSVDNAQTAPSPFIPELDRLMGPGLEAYPPVVQDKMRQKFQRHAVQTEQYYRQREASHVRFLELELERKISAMQAMIEHEKALIRAATQRSIMEEVELYARGVLQPKYKMDKDDIVD